MAKTVFSIEVDDSMIDGLAGGFCYGKSRFGIQEKDKVEYIRQAMERFANKNLNLFYDFQYKDRKIEVKPDITPITVTYKKENQ